MEVDIQKTQHHLGWKVVFRSFNISNQCFKVFDQRTWCVKKSFGHRCTQITNFNCLMLWTKENWIFFCIKLVI